MGGEEAERPNFAHKHVEEEMKNVFSKRCSCEGFFNRPLLDLEENQEAEF